MLNKDKFVLYTGVGVMTMALLMHMGININGNNKTHEVAMDNSQKIVVQSELEENRNDKIKGR